MLTINRYSKIMQLHCFSDLHFEHMRLPYLEFWASHDELMVREQKIAETAALHGVDQGKPVCVLAGDIGVWSRELAPLSYDALRQFVDRYGGDRVVYITGNHEYYQSKVADVDTYLTQLSQDLGFHYLTPGNPVTIDGQRFLGGTLWYPKSYAGGLVPDRPGDGRPPRASRAWRFSDFRFIADFEPWCYQQHADFRQMMEGCTADDVVISHHMPSIKSVHPKFAGDTTNCFFYSDLEDLILAKQPKFWQHGHSHSPFDYKIDGTRIYANPWGYPHENANPGFWSQVVVEV